MVRPAERGYVLIVLMMAVLVLAVGLTVAVPVLETELRREKEEELIFRGLQYVEAIRLYQTKYPGKFPTYLQELSEEEVLRKPYADPMSPSGEWNLVLEPSGRAGARAAGRRQVLVAPASALDSVPNPAILGVVSSSKKASIRLYENQDSYDKWLFFYGSDPKNPPKIVYLGQEGKDAGEGE